LAKQKSRLREYIEAILIAVLLALVVRTFVVQAFKIPSGSMIPTLLIGDHILVNKFIYGIKMPFKKNRFLILRQPRRGDIIVFSFPGNKKEDGCKSLSENIARRFSNAWDNKNIAYLFHDECRDFIKRLIGVGGDRIEIKNKIVYVNGAPLEEPYVIHTDRSNFISDRDKFGPITVPYGKFFVMGDNRDQSYDSRFWGFVDMNEIKGKAFIIYWSWNNEGNILTKVRWSRLGRLTR